jgi:hypothetical protein
MTDRPRNPDKRLDWADQETAQPAPERSPEVVPSVKVHTERTVITAENVKYGSYATYVLAASSGPNPNVIQLLPQDGLRQYAYVCPVDAPIVVATTQAEAQAAANIAAANPSGAYFPVGWSVPIRHREALWAANTSASASTRITVVVERGDFTG